MRGARRVAEREEGQALVEYAFLLVLVAVVAAFVLADLGPTVADALRPVVDAF